MLAHPFDEHFDGYGYEDELFGKTLAEHQISILHIDNAVSIAHYEPNPIYINKVEESLRTLSHHRQQIGNYSRLIRFQQRASWACLPLKAVFRMTRKPVRARLCKPNPPLWLFRFYQLGYYLCLRE